MRRTKREQNDENYRTKYVNCPHVHTASKLFPFLPRQKNNNSKANRIQKNLWNWLKQTKIFGDDGCSTGRHPI